MDRGPLCLPINPSARGLLALRGLQLRAVAMLTLILRFLPARLQARRLLVKQIFALCHPVQILRRSAIVALPVLGGLHHRHPREAA
jgi:hypothetical protein